MKPLCIEKASSLKGRVRPLGDKSIAHRALFLSSLAKGVTRIKYLPLNNDCLETINVLKKLGVKFIFNRRQGNSADISVWGRGRLGLKEPKDALFIQESGTTLRLLVGLLAGYGFGVRIEAGNSLSRRPMLRVNEPLRMMGAQIKSRLQSEGVKTEEYPPLFVKGGNLKGISYSLPVASAQVKSAILLAGLNAEGKTIVKERLPTRDHTERMLRLFGAKIKKKAEAIILSGGKELLSPGLINIPGDFSSASFFIVAATLVPDSEIVIEKVNLNPTRTGLLKILSKMGLRFKIYQRQQEDFEPIGNLLVRSSKLRGVRVGKEMVPLLIDELPVLMVAASLAKGKTIIEGVEELRVKETDRINSMCSNLLKMGANITISRKKSNEVIVIEGVKKLKGSEVSSFNDHRTAMSMVVAGLIAEGKTFIDEIDCIQKSFPNFLFFLDSLRK